MRIIKFNSNRKFGIEYEFCNPITFQNIIKKILTDDNKKCIVSGYTHNYNNKEWVCKTDSSCGMHNTALGVELVTPVCSGIKDLKQAAEILIKLSENDIVYNRRCGMHVHVEVKDFNEEEIGILLSWWIKIEQFILQSTPSHRRNNKYCLGLDESNFFIPNYYYSPREIYNKIIQKRHVSLNAQNFRERSTIEFRFGEMTMDPETVKNRVRFLIWFVDIIKHLPPPENLNLMSPDSIMDLLGLSLSHIKYSKAINSMISWLLSRFTLCSNKSFVEDKENCVKLINLFKKNVYSEDSNDII